MHIFQSNDIANLAFFWAIVAIFTGIYSAFILHSIIRYQKQWKKASLQKKWLFIFTDMLISIVALSFYIRCFL